MEGNQMKMREALEELAKFTCNSCERRLCEDDGEEEDGQKIPIRCSAVIRAWAALSAPARNCDLFDNWYDAHQAWERLPKDELGYFVAANGIHECEQAWFFDTATAERKGEGDGR